MKSNVLIAIVLIVTLFCLGAWYVGNVYLDFGRTSEMFDQKKSSLSSTLSKGAADSAAGDKYSEYSPESFAAAAGKKRVLFFHATWCPTCKVANEAFTSNPSGIPEDVIVFKTDYDTYGDLKKKYGITYQHTFVQVDEQGNELAKWNGGDIDLLRTNLK